MSDQTPTKRALAVSPFPDPGGVYLLVAGIVLGVLLGPAVLGRVLPGVYRDTFVGGGGLAQTIRDQQAQTEAQLQALTETGVTEAAIDEQGLILGQQVAVLRAQLQEQQRKKLDELSGWSAALVLAVLAVMLIESFVSPDVSQGGSAAVSPALGRLITARYALAAMWVALMLAQPKLLAQLPILFLALLIVVALGAALLPLGKKTE